MSIKSKVAKKAIRRGTAPINRAFSRSNLGNAKRKYDKAKSRYNQARKTADKARDFVFSGMDGSGIGVVEDNTEEVIKAINEAIEKSLEEIGLTAEGHAKKLCPVDTGRLRNSITHIVDDDEQCAYIGTNTSYGPMVELGHHSYPGANGGRGYLRPAATEHGEEYRRILEKNLRGN